MDSLLQDIRYGFRMLIHNPGFTAVAVIALALGIGGNSAIFSVVNAVLLKPLGYKDADRLVTISHNYPKLDLKASVSAVGYTHYRKVNTSFEDMAAYTGWPANLTESGEPERLRALRVTPSFFPTLGIGATMGRVFSADEDQQGREHVVVISDGLWRRRFGSDPGIIGRSIMLNGEGYAVVGITPPGFQFGSELGQPTELWAPITFPQQQMQPSQWTNEYLAVLARLKPNITLEKAQAEFDSIAANVRQEYFTGGAPKDAGSWNLLLRSFNEVVVGDIKPALLVLMVAVGLVLLIASANVANLLLARAAARQKEIAIRSALGAGRLRVIRQLLTESLLLAITGGGIGLLLGYWGVKLLVALNRDRIPRAQDISLDGWVVAFTIGISVLTGIVFGLVPALQSSRSDLHETLKEGGRSGSSGTRSGLRSTLVVTEIALALMLLVGAGLLIKSFIRLQQVTPGFQPQNVLVMQLSLPNLKYSDPIQVDGFYQRLLEKVKAIPGVKEESAGTNLPLSGSNSSGSFQIENRTFPPGQMSPWGSRAWVGSNYLQTLGVPLIKGRFFDDHDVVDAPGVAIIDETMARKFWADEDPIGKRITFEGSPSQPKWREIVGVVGHVKQRGLEGESPVQYYIPLRQRPLNSVYLVVRTSSDPSSLAPSVRGAIRSLDPELPVFNVTSMDQLVSDSMAQRRFSMFLFGIFAVVALVLASVGLSGVMAYSVTQRTHEIGIRMALGASRGQVLRLVVGQGMVLSAVGLGIGVVGALAATRLMAKLLFGVRATDPGTFVVIALVLAVVALVASYLPARLATRVDPMIALRYE